MILRHGEPDWVREFACVGKIDEGHNEDALVITEHFVAVLDGMSSPLRTSAQQPTGAVYATRAAEAIATLPASIDARGAADAMSEAVRDIRPEHAGPTGAVAAIYARERDEVWRIGDIHVRIGERILPGMKRVDAAMTSFRAALNAAMLARGQPADDVLRDDPGLRAARALLEQQTALANAPGEWGYGVINGAHIPAAHLETLGVDPGVDVVLASDGYLSAAATLDAAEAELRGALAADPLCIGVLADMGKAPRPGGMPDDRTYVRLAAS